MHSSQRAVLAAVACGLMIGSSAAISYAIPIEGELAGPEARLSTKEAHQRARDASGADPAAALKEYWFANRCDTSAPVDSSPVVGVCQPGDFTPGAPTCEVGTAIEPLWHRTRDTAGSPWSEWELLATWACPEDVLPEFTLEDFQRLPLAPPALHIQPERPVVLVNMPTITHTDAAPQVLTTTLLGYPIEVEATPTSYTWDYGDGTPPITTTSPGHPYPDHDVAHPYTAPGTYTITLTTHLSGRYRLVGTTTWHPITGAATTATTSPPLTAEERRSHLVTGPCTTHPAPDC